MNIREHIEAGHYPKKDEYGFRAAVDALHGERPYHIATVSYEVPNE